jgi:DNA-binding PadR family transcriptional regulator
VTVRNGLLALLEAHPAHGYELRARYESVVGGEGSLNIGQVYTTLQRLARDGLVRPAAGNGAADEGNRTPYELTPSGHAKLCDWVAVPVAGETSERDELLAKVLLAVSLDDVDANAVIATQRRASLANLQALTARKAALAPDAPLREHIAIDRSIARVTTEIDWLELCDARVRASATMQRKGSA